MCVNEATAPPRLWPKFPRREARDLPVDSDEVHPGHQPEDRPAMGLTIPLGAPVPGGRGDALSLTTS